ncbi:MAG: FAD-dependent oxidoreductase [Candidatus Binatia bacterium]
MENKHSPDSQVVVIGAGPAGLSTAYELTKFNVHPVVIEKYDKVGGLARTENYKGFHFDIGGHRFFTKVEEVNKMWHDLLGDEFLRRPRLSRIYYDGKYFDYPLKPLNALKGLGILESLLIVLSYLWWQIFPCRKEETFEQWVTNRFGKRLFETFFKTYTEKVWGIPCSELKAEWAAQRIKDLSLRTAVLNMFFKPQQTIKTLIDAFEYPRLGPGMMWNLVKEQVESRGGEVRLNSDVTRINRTGTRIESVVLANNGHRETIRGGNFISSMPITEFLKKLDPPPPGDVLEAANRLNYRDFLTVCLIVNKDNLFPDNWIYIHDPKVNVGRIQNFKNWSPEMVPDSSKTSLGLEYFCTEGDKLWVTPDDELVELAKQELSRIGLASYEDVEDGCVIRAPKAYPMYDSEYRGYLETVREFANGLENFQSVGRNGLHRYNNQDHAMLTGMLAVRNLVLGEKNDLWSVNTDQEYLEEVKTGTKDPIEKLSRVLEEALPGAFPKLDRVAFGVSLGATAGICLALATLILVLKGGETIGPNLQLLSQYFPGYTVTIQGSLLGLAYGFVSGFIGGWGFACLRNLTMFLSLALIHRKAERQLLRRLLQYI